MNIRNATYWASTTLLALVVGGSGLGALTRQPFLVEAMESIDFPLYVMPILGTAYVLGSIVVLLPRLPLLKEWAYAGIVFAMVGALASHASTGDPLSTFFPPVMILTLAAVSRALRPPARRLQLHAPDAPAPPVSVVSA